MTEVGGDAAIYFDPENPEDAAQIILENLHRKQEIAQAGRENVKNFTTDAMVNGYLKIYQSLLREDEANE